MYKHLLILLLVIYVIGCAPKLATKSTTKDYTEDVSAFRPQIESVDSKVVDDAKDAEINRGPYVPATHDINNEMSLVMDSIVIHNRDKMYLTYTIQVYIGRSREEANQIREKIYRILPEEKPLLAYRQPSYLVNVGKYFDRVEAYKTLTTLRPTFPGAMIVPERNHME